MSAVTVTVTMFSASSKAKENVLVKAAAVHDQHRSDRSHGAEYDTTYLSAIRLLLFTSSRENIVFVAGTGDASSNIT